MVISYKREVQVNTTNVTMELCKQIQLRLLRVDVLNSTKFVTKRCLKVQSRLRIAFSQYNRRYSLIKIKCEQKLWFRSTAKLAMEGTYLRKNSSLE